MDEVREVKEAINSSDKMEKPEKRIDSDTMSDPPISFLIGNNLAACVTDLMSRQEGHQLNCLVLGKYTGNWACVISDMFPPAGGRVLCLGDSVSDDSRPTKEWLETVGDRTCKTVFPVTGDISDNLQGMDRKLDLIFFSTCGDYAEMASIMSRWSGLVSNGGVVCGPQFDSDQYPATTDAITDVFGADKIKRIESQNPTSFWYAIIEPSNVKQ